MAGEELGSELGLHPRGIWDFFDALVALGGASGLLHSVAKKHPQIRCVSFDLPAVERSQPRLSRVCVIV